MESGYKYYLTGCSMPKPTIYTSLKNCSSKEFVNRFSKIPSYNAIHSQVKKSSEKQGKQNNHGELNKRISLAKMFASTQKQKNNAPSLLKNCGINSEQRRILLKNLINEKSDLNSNSQEKHIIYPQIIKRQTLKYNLGIVKSEIKKLNQERFSLKIKPNRKIFDQLAWYQRQAQKKSHVPSDHEIIRSINHHQKDSQHFQSPLAQYKQDQYRKNYEVLDKNRSSYPSNIRKTQSKQLMKQRKQIMQGSTQIRKSIWSLQKQLTQSMQAQQLSRVNAERQRHNFHRNSLKQDRNSSDKQNSGPCQNLAQRRHNYIKNFIKTTNIQRSAVDNLQDVIGQDQMNNLHSRNGSSYNSSNLISILHPDGQFSKDFQEQFNRW